MANEIKMDVKHSIEALYRKGWTQRRIARELGLHRKTVARQVLRIESEARGDPKCTTVTPGNVEADAQNGDSKCTKVTPGKPGDCGPNLPGKHSQCAPFRAEIERSLEQGLSAQRIYQDLTEEQGFEASYQSVKRFTRSLRKVEPKRFERVECAPGAEMQVDFGTGAWIVGDDGKRKRSWVFRVVLSHSRKGYSEAVFRQDSESFLRCMENAFRSFGGVPQTVVIDNLKAAVIKADWYDPELHPKLRDFAAHYNVVILPTKPYHPQHKGKVERGVAYVKDNALKGRTFTSLAAENAFLLEWEHQVADQRIHGTTRRQVGALFEQSERPALGLLAPTIFPCYREGRRKVQRDCFVEVAKSYYQAPPEYVGRALWVRWDGRTVRLFNHRMDEVAVHARVNPGVFSRRPGSKETGSYKVQQSKGWLLKEAQGIGYWCGQWAESLLMQRGAEAIRPLMGLRAMTKKHSGKLIDTACEQALTYGAFRLRDLRRLIEQGPEKPQEIFEFMTEHTLIRDLSEYQDVIGSTPQPKETT